MSLLCGVNMGNDNLRQSDLDSFTVNQAPLNYLTHQNSIISNPAAIEMEILG